MNFLLTLFFALQSEPWNLENPSRTLNLKTIAQLILLVVVILFLIFRGRLGGRRRK